MLTKTFRILFQNLPLCWYEKQCRYALIRLKMKGEGLTKLDEKDLVRSIFSETFACGTSTRVPGLKLIEEAKGSFTAFIPAFCSMTGIKDTEKKECSHFPSL